MSWRYRTFVRPFLFVRDPEEIHDRMMRVLGRVARWRFLCGLTRMGFGAPELPVEAFGLRFPNPIGLGAGMDKVGSAVPVWEAMGFGFSELGAVTWRGQIGNSRPRVFRVVAEKAVVNRMGFNNPGATAFATRLEKWRELGRWPAHPVGVNLGKSRITPLGQAPADYANSLRALWALADFFVVNVSSPNTPNLRDLQDRAALDEILAALQEVNERLSMEAGRGGPAGLKPILVKVSPDLSCEAMDQMVELVGPRKVAGFVATNTTTTRPASTNVRTMRFYAETGGLSGLPLRARSTEVVRHLYRQTEGRLPIIGVGGVFSTEDAWEKITAGARLVQLYTGLVYEGPGLPRQIVKGLRRKLQSAGLTHLREAVGIAANQSP